MIGCLVEADEASSKDGDSKRENAKSGILSSCTDELKGLAFQP